MTKKRGQHPFEDHPFAEDFLEWMGSPEGQRSIEASDALWELMEEVQLDARQRELIWPERERLSLDQSIQRIEKTYPDFPRARIESFLISWLENYAPETCSEDQLDQLDRLTEQWLDELQRQHKAQ